MNQILTLRVFPSPEFKIQIQEFRVEVQEM